MLESVTEYYRVLQSITEYCKVLQSITETNLAHLLGPIFGLVFLRTENLWNYVRMPSTPKSVKTEMKSR